MYLKPLIKMVAPLVHREASGSNCVEGRPTTYKGFTINYQVLSVPPESNPDGSTLDPKWTAGHTLGNMVSLPARVSRRG